MSSSSSPHNRQDIKYREICISNINRHTEPNRLLQVFEAYFEQYGRIVHYNYTSPTGGYVFITYEKSQMVDNCISNGPHYLDERHLYVKRALPIDDDHPRERFETTRDLMVVIDSDDEIFKQADFLQQLREYFSSYGRIYACKYQHEANFDYILVEFADKDPVDRIILDKPHHYNDHELAVMKYIQSNIELMNRKYVRKKQQSSTAKDAIDDDNYQSINSSSNTSSRSTSKAKEPINEVDLQNEVFRLQSVLKSLNDEFDLKQKQLEDTCCQQLKQLSENATKKIRLQQDLEQECARLLAEYETLKQENDLLNEQYLTVELENFEITSYYEQSLNEEKAKTARLEAEYAEKLQQSNVNQSPPSTLTEKSFSTPESN
ncbi:unnamed protein product [Adineta ricciae]|uniref:RRM domain-containing protein n=1 Tax=Adineta ricciae TaxID=249248 RepID=A0A814T033_ADIRI|nr:unnamed protein product [Adineta ricciae]